MLFRAPKLFSVAALIGAGLLLAVAMLLALDSTGGAEARYLPTRADESDVEVLKELIQTLLAESSLQDSSRIQGAKPGYSSWRDQFQLQRRAMEAPVASNNGQQTLLRAMGSSGSGSSGAGSN